MSCPYSDEDLERFDSVSNPMGKECYTCEDFDCEHNENDDNPDRCDPQFWEGLP